MPYHAQGIYYQHHQGSGTPLVWGHGLFGSIACEDEAGWLAWHRFPAHCALLRHDARGHGRSRPGRTPTDFLWSSLAEDIHLLAAAMDQFLAGGTAHRHAALYAALARPNAVKALILVTPPTAWQLRAAKVDVYRQLADKVSLEGKHYLLELAAAMPMLPRWLHKARPHVNQALLRAIAGMGEDQVGIMLQGAVHNDLPPRERLAQLQQPALILGWSDDGGHPLAVARALRDVLPNAQLAVAEDPDSLDRWPGLIAEFVQRHGGTS